MTCFHGYLRAIMSRQTSRRRASGAVTISESHLLMETGGDRTMLRLSAETPRHRDDINRRTFFRVGAASGTGLCLDLPGLLKAASGGSRAKSLILFALEGGP